MTGFHEKDNHPQHFFIFSAMVGALIFIAACIYPKSSESPPESHDHGSHSHQNVELTLKQKLSLMLKIFSLPKVNITLRFMFLTAITCFNWEVYIVYSNEEQ